MGTVRPHGKAALHLQPLKTDQPAQPRSTRLQRLRLAVASKLEVMAEATGLMFAASGATVAAVLGKFIIGLVLAALALGFLLRLKSRKNKTTEPQQLATTTSARFVTGLVSACEVAALVEATNLPVRFDQGAFHMVHWYLVLLAFFAAYFLQLPLVTRVLGKRRARSAA